MENQKARGRKVRLAIFTDAENNFLLSNDNLKEYFECNKKKDKLKVAAMIENDMRKSGKGLFRDADEISRRLDNMKTQYRICKKQEEGFIYVNWQYYERMKEIFEQN
jgi:hypothetical protein